MAIFRQRLLPVTTGIVALGLAAGAFAQRAPGQRLRVPLYDTQTEATFSGTVKSVARDVPTPRGRRSVAGTHVTLNTGSETIEAHLGPTAFLKGKKVEIAEGDVVEIRGSRVTVDDHVVVLTREVKKGSTTWTLRDSSGRPLWSAGRR